MLDTVLISVDDVCCSVVFGTLVCVMWPELLLTSAISCPVCIDGRRYVCCNECKEPTPCLV